MSENNKKIVFFKSEKNAKGFAEQNNGKFLDFRDVPDAESPFGVEVEKRSKEYYANQKPNQGKEKRKFNPKKTN